MMRSVTQLEWMEDAAKFRQNFDISEDSWIRAMCLATGDIVLKVQKLPITADEYDSAMPELERNYGKAMPQNVGILGTAPQVAKNVAITVSFDVLLVAT